MTNMENGHTVLQDRTEHTGSVVPPWVPETVHLYLAHTGAGMSIRDLARLNACHASTISRRIRRIEQQRDDPLIDAALRRIESQIEPGAPELRRNIKRNLKAMSTSAERDRASLLPNEFDKESMRVLRRLCETGAVLAIAADMDMAVVVREANDGSTTRTAVVAQEIAQAMALKGWIETTGHGRILRYCITSAGRDTVKDHLQALGTASEMEMAEAPAHFEPAPRALDEDGFGSPRKLRYNLAESPLTALARRRDKDGTPFLSEDLVRCGERLREDFELAQMGPQVTQNWTQFLLSGGAQVAAEAPKSGYGPEAAKSRVVTALQDLGPGLSDIALRCCCFLEGLENTEKRMGWSARSGKIVLRIALQRLKQHYDTHLTGEAQMIG